MARAQQVPRPAAPPTDEQANFLSLARSHEPGEVLAEYAPEIDAALARVTEGDLDVTWIQGQSCTGCTISLLQGEYPDLESRLSEFRSEISFHPTLMGPAGDQALDAMSQSPDVLIVEGSIPTKVPRAATLGVDEHGNRKPILEWVVDLGREADLIVAIGSCAAYGGIPAAGKHDSATVGTDPTGARGLQYDGTNEGGVFGPDFETGLELPVVNIPGCPAHPDHVLLTLATVLNGHEPELDQYNRPMPLFEPLVHDECPLREDYECRNFACEPGDDGCLYGVGCAGVYAYCDDSKRLRNGNTAICRTVGAPCIGCVEPAFWDRFTPFYKPGEDRGNYDDPVSVQDNRGMRPNAQMDGFGHLFTLPIAILALPAAPVVAAACFLQKTLGIGTDDPCSWK